MATTQKIKVWDPLVRVFHWGLVGAFTLAYLTEDDFMLLHSWAGYVVFGLIMVRVVWGFIGPRYARFKDFVHSPRVVRRFLKQTVRLRARRYLGHNPAGGAMIVLLLISLLLTTVTGMAVYGAGDNAGPLAAWLSNSSHFWQEALEGTHEFFANFTLLLVFIHVAGVIVEGLIHRENLVRSMIDGYKREQPGEAVEEQLS